MRAHILSLVTLLTLSLVPGISHANNMKDDGGDAKIPGCYTTYTTGTNCTSGASVAGEGIILSATQYYERTSSRTVSSTPPPPFAIDVYGVNTCGAGAAQFLIDCTVYCPAIGYASGVLATATPSCGIAGQPYCACSTPGSVIVDHADVTPSSTSIPVNTCVQVDVALYDASNNIVAAPTAYMTHLRGGNATGRSYYSDAACTTTISANILNFAAGDTTKTVYYKNSAAGNVNIQVVFPGLVARLVPISFY